MAPIDVLSIEAGAPVRFEQNIESTTPSTILIIEDDTVTAEFLPTLLTDAGYTAVKAEDGPTALSLLDSQLFDLVLMSGSHDTSGLVAVQLRQDGSEYLESHGMLMSAANEERS